MKNRILFFVIIFSLCSQKIFAWGWCHELVGYVAHEHCTEKTKLVLDRYLDVPLNDVASWMDNYRSRAWVKTDYSDAPDYTFTSLWHAVSVDENYYPLMNSNRPDGNGDGFGALVGCIEQLKNYQNFPDSTVVVNIKFITHLVADIVCPGHILHSFSKDEYDPMGGGLAAGYGKWTYNYKGKNMTLHALIDGAAANCHPEFKKNMVVYGNYLDSATIEEKRAIADMPLDLWVQSIAKDSKQIFEWDEPGALLDESWYAKHEPYFMDILRSASYKLADVLNTLFDPEYKTL